MTREINDLEETVKTPWPEREPKGPRGRANRRRRMERSGETQQRLHFYSTGNQPSLPRFKCLDD